LELTKLSMSGVGYKRREKIGKVLKTCAEAIQKAVAEYNIAASQLKPPREQLTYADILKVVALAEFDDVRKLPWANPARHKARRLHFGIKRAKEEIRRLNIEITRLITFMIDDHIDYTLAIHSCSLTEPHLARQLSDQLVGRARINGAIVEHLVKASQLPGFSGTL
ncbi:hypothetical protein C8R43DRAFT_841201, partial [Mycena crocata]